MQDVPVTVFAAGSGAPVAARGTLAPGVLVVTLHDGRAFTLALDEVSVRLGGASGKMLYVGARDGTTVAIDVPGFPAALRTMAAGALDEPLAAFASKVRGRRHWDRIVLGVVLGLSVAFGAFVLSLPRILVRGISRIPKELDQTIGAAAYDSLAPESELVRDPVVVEAVRRIVARLAPTGEVEGFALEVRVLARPDVNAFALPGGKLVVCAGLLAEAEAPEAVAGVLAHEIAHVTERHGLERMLAGLGISLGMRVLIGDLDFLPAYASDGAVFAALQSFSRTEELEADDVGMQTMVARDLDPRALGDVFRLLADQPGSELPGMVAWMSSHPGHDDRIANVARAAHEAGARNYRPLDEPDWAAVRAAASKALQGR